MHLCMVMLRDYAPPHKKNSVLFGFSYFWIGILEWELYGNEGRVLVEFPLAGVWGTKMMCFVHRLFCHERFIFFFEFLGVYVVVEVKQLIVEVQPTTYS